MLKYSGKGVYGAIAVGRISVFKRQDVQVKRTKIESADAEISRLETAKEAAIAQLQEIYEKALKEVGEANAQIFEIHMMMVEDDDYNEAITEMIRSQNVNAEYAVAVTADNFAEMFASMDDSYMQARAADVRDISNRIISCMSECISAASVSDEKVIICADDLAPSETVSLDKEKVLAFVTARGSSNSHTAILARNMNIPAIIGLGEEFLSRIKDGDMAIADVEYVMQTKRNQCSFNNTIDPCAGITGFQYKLTQLCNACLNHRPYIEHSNTYDEIDNTGDDRNKSRSAEEGKHLRQLDLIESVVQCRNAETYNNTAENAHLKRGDTQYGCG